MTNLNIDDVVAEVRLDTRKSQKSGREYQMLVVVLENGYEYETFIDKAVAYMVNGLVVAKQDK